MKAFNVGNQKKLDHASVRLPKHIRYLSLKDTLELAVHTAITGNRMKLAMATEVTVWNCLGVHVPRHDVFKMVQCGLLVRDISRGGWRDFGALDFRHLSHQWFQVSFFYPRVSRLGLRRPRRAATS